MTAPRLVCTATEGGAYDIRPGMDVFNAYQDRYIGSVVSMVHGPTGSGGDGKQNSGPIPLSATVSAAPTEQRGQRMLGEELGPVPTIALGNTGPDRQSAANQYATHPQSTRGNATHIAIRPGRLNLGPLSRVVYVPVEAVRSLSMERLVVELGGAAIPTAWKKRPTV